MQHCRKLELENSRRIKSKILLLQYSSLFFFLKENLHFKTVFIYSRKKIQRCLDLLVHILRRRELKNFAFSLSSLCLKEFKKIFSNVFDEKSLKLSSSDSIRDEDIGLSREKRYTRAHRHCREDSGADRAVLVIIVVRLLVSTLLQHRCRDVAMSRDTD